MHSLPYNWRWIVIHHSAGKDLPTLQADDYRRFHMSKGWADIGYHFGIEQIEANYEVVVGRPLTMTGSHAPGYNEKAIGIVFAGDFTDAPPPEAMLVVAAKRIIIPMMRTFNIERDWVIGHRDTGRATDCPGKMFSMDILRKII